MRTMTRRQIFGLPLAAAPRSSSAYRSPELSWSTPSRVSVPESLVGRASAGPWPPRTRWQPDSGGPADEGGGATGMDGVLHSRPRPG
jgi:hypothetical protein